MYFRLADCKTQLLAIDKWLRRKIRCIRLKQLKRRGVIIAYLAARGVKRDAAVTTASSGKGWWRLSGAPAVNQAMNIARLTTAGLINLSERYLSLRGNETAGCDIARPVV